MKMILSYFIFLLIVIPAKAQDKKDGKISSAESSKKTSDSIGKIIERAVQIGKTDTSKADKIFRVAIARAKQENNSYLTGRAYFELGQMYFLHKNHNRSFGAYFNARAFFTRADARKEIAYTVYSLGRQQYYRGNYKVAAEHLNFAMREAETMKLIALESDALEYLGILYHVMPGTDQLGIADFKKSLSIKQKLRDQKGMLRMLEKLGDVYYQQKHYDSALYYLNQSIDLATALKLYDDAKISRLNRAATYVGLHRMREAEKDISRIAIEMDTSDLNIMVRYFIQRGNYRIAERKFDDAKYDYDNALGVAGRIGVPEMYGMVYKNMADAYSSQEMFKEAYRFSQQYIDQMAGYYAENVNAIKDLEYIFNNSLTKDEIAYLSGENKLKEVRLQDEKRLRVLLLSGAAIFLLLSASVFYLYRKQRNKNIIIKKQADDLQTLMKEIHHRVKNNLQIISSLLDLQSMIVKDNQAAQAIKDGRNRVQSMALIHQKLYGEKSIKGIAIDDYINNLTQSLFDSYNIQPGQIALNTDIEKLEMDVDTVIPIGLMLNELITNSLKHAFGNGKTGRIDLTLKKCNGILLLQVKDNGRGFSETADPVHSTSFGMRMIKIFAQKLKAELEIYNDGGACVTLRIRKYKMSY